MPIGPGKYDDLCTIAREAAKAEGVLLVVLNGNRGNGFACQATLPATLGLPAMLRHVADEIERSGPFG